MKKIILIAFIIQTSIQFVEAQWIQQNSGTNQNLYDIEFINDKSGWAVGDAGVVIKTTNGGMNWMNVPNPSGQYGGLMWSICPVDSEFIYAVAGYDFIMKSTNGGINWNVLSGRPGSISAFKGLYFLNRDTGWFVGTNKVFRTYDGGITLDSFYAPWFTNYDIYFKDINTGVFCGSGRVFKSTDGGMNWFDTNVPTIGVFYEFRKLAVVDNNVWVTGSGNPPVYRSTDFCETWEVTDTVRNYPPSVATCIGFSDENTGWVGGSIGYLYKTTNSGFNWRREALGSDIRFWSSIYCYSDSILWGVGGAGKMQHTTTGGQTLVKVVSIEENIPEKFELNQNYPNPFNSQTKISFSIKQIGIYSLEIYNNLGQRIFEVFNKKISAGEYESMFDASDLNSGIYYYKLTGNNISITKKFVLIK